MIVAFGVLFVLVGEPMHPHGLSVALLGGFALLVASGPPRRVALAGGLGGALLAALVLTKVNLGVYAIAAVALAAVLTIEPLQRRRWLRLPVIAGLLAMPPAVLARDLSSEWALSLAALEILAAGAIVVAARALRPRPGEDDEGLVEWLIAAACAFAFAFAAILIAILLTGPSPADVYEGTVTQAMRVRDALVNPFLSPPAAIDWGIAALLRRRWSHGCARGARASHPSGPACCARAPGWRSGSRSPSPPPSRSTRPPATRTPWPSSWPGWRRCRPPAPARAPTSASCGCSCPPWRWPRRCRSTRWPAARCGSRR
jgi:hypothetical protein